METENDQQYFSNKQYDSFNLNESIDRTPSGKFVNNENIINLNEVNFSEQNNSISNYNQRKFDDFQPECVIKAAKSLFFKRTRTLYHWMLPNAPKQQLTEAISNAWDKISPKERELYIIQVLGRFGNSSTGSMINPQLQVIKNFQDNSSTIYTPQNKNCTTTEVVNKAKKRRGRPLGSKSTKKLRNALYLLTDFQDDPELSLEMGKFVTNIYNNIQSNVN